MPDKGRVYVYSPGDRAQCNDNQQRSSPYDHFKRCRMMPFRIVSGRAVRLPVPPREEKREEDNRDDNDQHQDRRNDDEIPLLGCDVSGR